MFAMFIESFSHPVLFSSAICASFCAWMFCTEPKARNGLPVEHLEVADHPHPDPLILERGDFELEIEVPVAPIRRAPAAAE